MKHENEVRANVRGLFEDVSIGVLTMAEAIAMTIENDMSRAQRLWTVKCRAADATWG